MTTIHASLLLTPKSNWNLNDPEVIALSNDPSLSAFVEAIMDSSTDIGKLAQQKLQKLSQQPNFETLTIDWAPNHASTGIFGMVYYFRDNTATSTDNQIVVNSNNLALYSQYSGFQNQILDIILFLHEGDHFRTSQRREDVALSLLKPDPTTGFVQRKQEDTGKGNIIALFLCPLLRGFQNRMYSK